MIKSMPDLHCGKSKLQLVHYKNRYGHVLKQPGRWNDVDKVWENPRGETITNVIDFEPMTDDWQGGLEP